METEKDNQAQSGTTALIFLLLLMILQGFALFRWTSLDTRPLEWDQAIHTQNAFEYRSRIADGRWGDLFKPTYFDYPPLYHLSLVPFLRCTSHVEDVGAVVNFFYLGLMIISVYFIARMLLGLWPALVSAALIGSYPMVASISRETMVDLSLASLVTVSVLFLLKSDSFKKMSWSLAFGAAVGLAMLVKWTALAYVIGPLGMELFRAVREKRFRNIALSLAMAAIVMGPWYVPNLVPMLVRIPQMAGQNPASGFQLEGWSRFLWYPIGLFEQLNPVFVFLLVPGLAAAIWKRRLLPVLLWLAVSFFLFSLISNKNVRYTLPALPAAAILSAAWLPSSKKLPSLLVLLITTLFFSVYHFGNFPAKLKLGRTSVPWVDRRPPKEDDWKHDEIIGRVLELKPKDTAFAKIITVSNAPNLHTTTLNVTLETKGIKEIGFKSPSKRRWLEFGNFILLKTGRLGPEFSIKYLKECAQFLKAPPAWFKKGYKEAGRWKLPDNTEAVLYQWNPAPVPSAPLDILNVELGQMDLPNIHAEGVSIRAVPLSNKESRVGRFKELRMSCRSVVYKGVVFSDVSLRLVRPQINLPLFKETQEIQLMELASLNPSCTVRSQDLIQMIEKKGKKVRVEKLDFAGSGFALDARYGKVPLELKMTFSITGKELRTRVDRLRLARVPFPLVLIRALTDRTVPLDPNPRMPFEMGIESIAGTGESVRIESAGGRIK